MKRKFRWKLVIWPAAVLLLLCGAVLIPYFIIDSETTGLTYSDISAVPRHRVALILGCPKKLSGNRDNLYFTHRINAAVSLFRAGKADYLLVSGDNVSRGCTETVSMRADLIKYGVPAERIYCDFRGMRTLDSIVRAKTVFGLDDLLIVSQEFHNRRAVFIARHYGINAIGFNAEDVDFPEDAPTHLRDILSRLRAALDIYVLDAEPRFSGERVVIGTQGGPATGCVGK
jgi:SanA protein